MLALLAEGFQVVPVVKSPPTNAGDLRDVGLIPGSGRSPGGAHGNPLQYSCLENPMGRGAWQATVHRVAKSGTQPKRLSMNTLLSDLHFVVLINHTHLIQCNLQTDYLFSWLPYYIATSVMKIGSKNERSGGYNYLLPSSFCKWSSCPLTGFQISDRKVIVTLNSMCAHYLSTQSPPWPELGG